MKKAPYDIVKSKYVTEKARVLSELKNNQSNKSVARFVCPKYVFLVDSAATKPQIAAAIEEIYSEKKVKVKSVNTITVKPKKCRMRGRAGVKSGFKKAIVTFTPGAELDEQV